MRDHTEYAGQTIQSFTVMAEFQKSPSNAYAISFDTFETVADFDADGDAVGRLRFRIDPAVGFGTANQALLVQLRDMLLNELGLAGRGFTFSEFQWMPVSKVMTVTAIKGQDAASTMIFTKRADEYDVFMEAEGVIFDDLMAACWTHGKSVDGYLNAMAPVVVGTTTAKKSKK